MRQTGICRFTAAKRRPGSSSAWSGSGARSSRPPLPEPGIKKAEPEEVGVPKIPAGKKVSVKIAEVAPQVPAVASDIRPVVENIPAVSRDVPRGGSPAEISSEIEAIRSQIAEIAADISSIPEDIPAVEKDIAAVAPGIEPVTPESESVAPEITPRSEAKRRDAAPPPRGRAETQIGRASCRERV